MAGGHASAVLAEAAVICFVLVGALVLRILTKQEIWAKEVGLWVGLGYSAALIFGSLSTGRAGAWFANNKALPIAGLLLAILMSLETYHAWGLSGTLPTVLAILAAGFSGTFIGARFSRRVLTTVSIGASLLAIGAVGASTDHVWIRVLGVPCLVVLALELAKRPGWWALRSLSLIPAMLVLGLGVLLSAGRPEYAQIVLTPLSTAVFLTWVIVALNHWRRQAVLRGGEAAWLPICSIWGGAIGFAAMPTMIPWICLGLAGLLWVAMSLAHRFGRDSKGAIGIAAAVLVLASLGLFALDSTGLSLGGLALISLIAGRRAGGRLPIALSEVLVVGSAVSIISRGGLATLSNASEPILLAAGFGLSLLLVAHYYFSLRPKVSKDRPGPRLSAALAPFTLISSLLVGYLTARLLVALLTDVGGLRQLVAGLLVASGAVALLAYGHLKDDPISRVVGYIVVSIHVARVLLLDLTGLDGGYLLGSVLSLGVVLILTSQVVRVRAAKAGEGDEVAGISDEGDERLP